MKGFRKKLLAFAFASCVFAFQPAFAATFLVNSTVDDVDVLPGDGVCATAGGVCTLRAAIQEANEFVDADTITLPAGTYTLARSSGDDGAGNGDLDITEDLTINGAGVRTTTVAGGTGANLDRVFDIRSNSTVSMTNITVTDGNDDGGDGGGIRTGGGTITNLTDVAVTNNLGKTGGGIHNSGTLNLLRVTVSGNQATSGDGGGIRSSGGSERVFLTNVTISGNTATDRGGGAQLEHGVLLNVTITANTAANEGAGLERVGGEVHTHKNTIIAGNTGLTQCDNVPTSLGNNLSGDASCSYIAAGDIQNGNALLGALADNGGPTDTHALLAGSDALDAGDSSVCIAPDNNTDQRLFARPVGGACDIGAFEATVNEVSGTVWEDLNGDSNLVDGVRAANVRVRLYSDANDNGVVDAGDVFAGESTTDVNGDYSLFAAAGAGSGKYLVAVDSKTLAPSSGFVFGFSQGDVWAQQTYGDDPATAALDLASRYGGRTPATSDAVDPADTSVAANEYQHLGRVDLSAGDVAGVDFGFSFNVLTNTKVGDDDAGSNRLIQGGFAQFIQNANAIAGGNSMRFVPAVAPNSGSWWTITTATGFASVQDAGTTIDGRAYQASDGITVRDENPGEWVHPVLAGKAVGTGPDGREGTGDEPLLPSYFNPELEIDFGATGNPLQIQATNTTVRRIAVFNSSNRSIRVNGGSGNLIEKNFVGLRADGSDPGAALRSINGIVLNAGAANVLDNVTAYLEGAGIQSQVSSLVQGNEVYSTGLIGDATDGITLEGSIGQPITIRRNRIYSSSSSGIETWQAPGPFTIENNTVMQSGRTGNIETNGIRVFGDNSVIRFNVVTDNAGNGIAVPYITSIGTNSSGNRISRNATYANGSLGIDLDQTNTAAADNPNGDGVTQNDGGTVATQQNIGFDFPVLDQAGTDGTNLTLTGFARPGAVIELFISDSDATGFGEGQTYLLTVTEGGSGAGGDDSFADIDIGTGSYTNPFNGLNQGTDPAASRFRYVIPLASLPGVGIGTVLTATGRDASGNTSEFSGNLAVTTTYSISGTVYHDSNANNALDVGELGLGNQGWVKLIDVSSGNVIAVLQPDFDEPDYTGDFSFGGLTNGNYQLIVDDNADPADIIATAPFNWAFQNPAPGAYPVPVTIANADVTGQEYGLTFDLVAPCACGTGDGNFTQVAITIDGNMNDWAAPLSDLDNNACDEVGAGDRDDPIQSTGRDMVRVTVTFDATRFYMFTERAASTNNTQNYIYYGDTNNNGLMEDGEPALVAEWSGNTGNVNFERYTYVAADSVFGDRMADVNGFADGYTLPGYLSFVETLPAADAIGSTSGPTDGIQMEWGIDWAKLGVPAGTAISWHTSSTNSNSYENANFPNQVDDNMGGCGGQCAGSNQFGGVDPNPVAVVPGATSYLVHQFTNTGNGIDRFDLESISSGDWAPVSYAYYRDLGTVGQFDPADVLLTDTDGDSLPDTGVLAPGEVFDLLVAVTLPPPPAAGTTTVTTTAESNFQPGCGALLTPAKGEIDDILLIPGVDIAVTKTDGNVSAIPGQPITYTINVTNNGPDDAAGIQITDTFDPAIFDVATVSWTCGIVGAGSCADAGPTSGDISTTVDLESGSVATFTVNAPTLAGATGTVTNTATATVVNETETDASNNSGIDNDTVLNPQGDLSLAKTVNNATPQAGDTIVFTLTVNNAGPSNATNITVTDLLPAGYAYQSDDGGGSYAPGTGVWTVGTVAAAAATALNITVTVNATGPYANTAEVTASDASDPDSIPGNGDPGEDDYSSNTPVVNFPPVANDDGATTPTDTLVAIDVLANDTDANGDALTITLVDSPTANGGTTVINDNGTAGDPSDDFIDYTPAAGFAGNDTFTYTISDGNGGTDTATVTVGVNNAAPVANDDAASTNTDTLVNIAVLANDTDANGHPLSITAFDNPTANGGSTAINDNGTPADPTDDTIDYTPAAGFAGTDTFTYTISDGNGGSDTATVTVTVNNAAPVANDDAASTNTDTAVNVDVLANDTDANADALTITASDSPTTGGGTTVINDNGTPTDPSDDTIDYTPAAGFAGSDTFTYTISDGNGGSDTATVTVTVNNAAPIANDDAASTNTDTAVNVDVLANDTDANGDPLTITLVDNPTANGGTAVINDGGTPADPSDDTIDYTPAAGFAGSDTFTYTISDGNGGSDTATVTVTVNNAAPIANDDAASTNTDTLVNVAVLANDTDANGDPLSITAFDNPTANGGSTVINDNGTPADLTDDTIDYTPAAGFAGSDTFTYTISDGNGGSDTATVTVTVNNAAPVANDDGATTPTDTLVAIDVLANDTDANGDTLTITLVDNPTANGGTASINDNGTAGDPSDDFIDYTPSAGFAGSDTFTYTISDGNGGTDTATVTVGVNNAPPVANDDAASTNTDTAVNITVLANDTDANGHLLSITAFDNPTANGGSTAINDNGTPADSSDDTIDYTPAAGFAGNDTFTYTISDGNGGTDTATVTVTVNNAAPVANDDGATTPTDTLVAIDVLANDTDANGDPLSISAFDDPTANGGTTVLNDNGTPGDPSDDTIDYTPFAGFAGSDTFTYTISDGNGGSDTATVTVTVNNAAPIANDDAASTNTDTAVNIAVLANDTDANADPLTITAADSPTTGGGTTVINGNGTPADPTDDSINYTPAAGFAGSDTFTYTISDGQGGTDTATVTVTVNNAAPIANDDAASTNTDTLVNVAVLANDTDANGDPLSITAFDNPTANGGSTVINDNGTPADLTDDTIDYTPAAGFAGSDTFTYTISDGNGGSDTATVTVTVNNAAPLANDDGTTTPTDTPVAIDVLANDTDANGDALTITLVDSPTTNGGAASINDNGTAGDPSDDFIDYTPPAGFAGNDTFTYTISDGNGGSDTATVTVGVNNAAPVANDDAASTNTDTLVDINVLANDTDANGDPLTITASDSPTTNGGSTLINDNGTPADATDDTIDYTPAAGFKGSDTFTYTISDGNGGSDTATVTVTVNNAAPVANDDAASTNTDTPVNIDVLANDADANNDTLTIAAADDPSVNGGKVTIQDNGTPADPSDDFIEYKPAAGFAGSDTFTYTISDGDGGSDTATVTVTVNNAVPVANDDAASTGTDTPVNIAVLANDTDANGDPLSITALDNPTANGGTAVINDNGTPADPSDDTIDYTPAVGFAGSDTFTYTISDGNGGSDTATVTVTVNNAAPVANDDAASTNTDTAVNIDVLANDTDANGDPLAITASDSPTANGGATVINDGGTPANPSDDTIDYTPAAGFAGTDTFTYTVSDGNGGSDTATVTVTVNNAAPIANDDGATTPTDTPVNIDVLANDTDANGDPLTITLVDNPTANGGTAVINDGGTPADPSDDTIDYTPAAGFTGPDTFTYTVSDGNGGSDTATVTIGVDNASPVADDDAASTNTDAPVNIDVLANDTDANGDPVTITASDSPTANGGTTVINDNGTPGDPSDDTVDYTPAAGFAGTDTFTYTISDGNGGFDTATVTVTVNNAAPVANDDAVTTNTDTAVNIDVLANDTDANGDALIITAADDPSASGGKVTIQDNGTPADSSDDFIEYKPAAGFAGTDTFTYSIDDGQGGTDTATVTVTVNNAAPVANDDGATTPTDTAVAIDVLANDTDANSDPLTITLVDSPTANGGTTVINDNGTPGDPSDDFIDYTPAAGFAGSDTFTYTIDDGSGGTDTATVTVAVNNAAPVANDDVASTNTDTAVNVDVLANDTDGNADPLTITASDSPTTGGGTTVINDNGTPADPSDDTIDYTPAAGFAGSDTFAYTISDGNGGSDTATVTVTVNNAAPIANDDGTTTPTDTPVTTDVLANDTDANGDTLTITLVDSPTANGGTTVINDNGTPADPVDDFIDYTPPAGFAGNDTFTYTISDGNGGTDTATVTVGVNNAAPVANDDAASTNTDTLVNIAVLANDTDANGDPLSITVFDNPTANGGSTTVNDNGTPADPTDDSMDYTPAAGFAGTDTFTYTVSDGSGGSDTATVTITVNNAAPVANDDSATTDTGVAVNVDVLANDSDANNDALTITTADDPTVNGGKVSIQDNGTPADPSDDFIEYKPAAGFAGSDTFTYTISDGAGGIDTATVTVTVNNAAPIANDDSVSTAADTPVNVDVLANDTDANGDPLSITAFDNPTANGGSTTINDNGTPADPSDDTIDYTPAVGFIGFDTFGYAISDGEGGTDTATVTVAVANAVPVANDDAAGTNTDTAVNVDVLANDTDGNGDPLTITASDSPTTNGGSTVINNNGTPADPTDDTIDYTPAAGFAGSDAFTYTISDGNGGSGTATVTITVNNAAPVANDDAASTSTGSPTNIAVLANDTDANGDVLTITLVDSPTSSGGTTFINDNGTPADPSDDFINYTPPSGFAGNDTFTYTISDGVSSDTATVTISVSNAPPVANDDVASTAAGTSTGIAVLVNDTDANGDAITLVSATSPTTAGGTAFVDNNGSPADPTDDTVLYTPPAGFAGADTFSYTISDGTGGTDSATVTVNVANAPPMAADDTASTIANSATNIAVLANDTDANGDALTLSLPSGATTAGGSVVVNDNGTPADPADDYLVYTAPSGFVGVDTFTYAIDDGQGGMDTATVFVTIVGGADGSVDITDSSFPGDALVVTVVDADLDTNPAAPDTVVVTVGNNANGESEQFSLTETGNSTGEFTGSIATTLGSTSGANNDGVLVTQGGDTVSAIYNDALDATGNSATRTDTGTVEGLAGVQGVAWFDKDADDVFDVDEQPVAAWLIEVRKAGAVILSGQTSADGSYGFADLRPDSGYDIVLIHPTSGAVWDRITDISLPVGTTVVDQNLPVDPSGVVYDAVARIALSGAIVSITGRSGQSLPAVCLFDGQQDQVTGVDGGYRFDVSLDADPACPSGAEFGISVAPPPGYNPGISQLIPPQAGPLDASGQPDPFRVVPQVTAPQAGEPTTYYLSFQLDNGDPDVINNHVPLDPLGELDLRLLKRVLTTRASVGDLVSYSVSVENTSSRQVRGLALRDEIPAGFAYVDGSARRTDNGNAIPIAGTRPVDFGNFDIAPGEKVEISYVLRVGPGVTSGDYINRVSGVVGDFQVGATASATIEISSDTEFGETTIVGKVFNDRNGDGWQDPGEEGIPGARLATVTGLLVETDQTGRYHIVGIDGGLIDRGRNFILKLDPATLPKGSRVTTENPRVLRITQGLLNRIDFGVRLQEQTRSVVEEIEVKLGEVFFVANSAEIREQFKPLLKELAERLREHGGGMLTIEGNAELEKGEYTVTPRFATRSAQLMASDRAELDKIITQWRGAAHVQIAITGHSDNVPIAARNQNEFKDNYALSEARARAVGDYLAAGLGVAPGSVKAVGRGPDTPIASNATSAGQARNRRVEVAFTGYRAKEQKVLLNGATAGQDLPTRRAQAIFDALRSELGEDLIKSVSIRVLLHPPENVGSAVQKAPSGIASRLRHAAARSAMFALSVLAAPAYADEPCTVDLCKTEEGYAVQIINHVPKRPDGPMDSRYAREDDRRVDVSGKFKVVLPADGLVWATEDPSVSTPRLAVRGPVQLPVENGVATEVARFVIYTNYPSFISSAELQIFEGDDTDRVKPLAVLPLRLKGLDRLEWDAQPGNGQALVAGESLAYLIKVTDEAGRVDETRLQTINLIDRRDFEATSNYVVASEKPGRESDPEKLTPMKGNVLVMRPPSVVIREYTLTPRFATRMTELSATDKAELDKIISDWKDHENLQITAIGHTDNVRIAPENRHEFADNKALSEARANTVGKYLMAGLSLSPAQVAMEGRGDSQPAASNASAAGRARNRRVEVRIVGKKVLSYTDLRLVNPETGGEEKIHYTLKEAENLLAAQAHDAEIAKAAIDTLPAWRSGEGLVGVYGQNDLVRQNIPIYGSRVRLYGHGITEAMDLLVNNQPLPVDRDGRFAVEYLMPVGRHRFEVGFRNKAGDVQSEVLNVEVTGRHMFLVGLADMTVSGSDLSGSMEPLSGDDRYQEDFLVEGRLAFYLKGKVKGKYLVTAQMDTQEEELGDLFSNIHRKDPRSVFRRLDPDRYYPVYGDDSTTYSDTDTQGRMYVRVDWDKSEVLWGNYHTGVTGNEFGQYNRSLYGARLHNRSLDTTELGEAKRDATVFVSEAQTALGHSEFLGTGGSLYYLRHQDILPGSEKAHVEIRDRDSNRVVQNLTLVRGTDYEIDELQGRLILARPLAQVTQQFAPSLIKDQPLDGNDVFLLVDYEYVPDAFQADQMTMGGRGKQWINDKVAVGVTAVDENRGGEDYQLLGADVTLQAGRGTYLKAEVARTEATQAPVFYSDNGGLSFATTNPVNQANREGDALSLEGRINFREQGLTQTDWTAATWWRQSEAGFSAARRDTGTELTEYGAEVTGEVNDRFRLSARLTVVDRAGQSEDQRVAVQGDYRLTDKGSVSAEVRRQQTDNVATGTSLESTLAALRYTHRLGKSLEVHATGQFSLSKDAGIADNNLGTVGARWRVTDRTNLAADYSSGNRGDAATLSLDHRINSDHRVSGAFTMSADRTDRDNREQQFTLGNRSRISNQTTIFTESQFSRGQRESGVTHAFGLNFIPRAGWDLGLSLQHGELDARSGPVQRDAATLTGRFRNPSLEWNSKIEYRDDAGAEQREQILSSNRASWRMSESLRMLMRFNFSDTDDLVDRSRDARFVEGGLGIAYRPVNNDRLNLLGRYTYLYDLPSSAQSLSATDQRSHVLSAEGIYRLNPKWEIGAKVSQRSGKLRVDRNTGQWFSSTTNFYALRGRYHLIKRWDGVLEYRWLEVEENDASRAGLLAAIDRHFGEHFKIGIGYNFTDFSDDLTNLDYDRKGWFLNLVGKY